MDKTYKVVFDECNGFHKGDLVKGHAVARSEFALAYLVAKGVIEFVSAPTPEEILSGGAKNLSQKADAAKTAKKEPVHAS